MTIERNKSMSRRLFERAWNDGNMDVVDELLAREFAFHDPQSPPVKGPDGFKQLIQMYRNAFPDLRFVVEDQIAEDHQVMSRFTAKGTHRGELMGMQPTGKRSSVTGIIIDRFSDGKIVESWANWDTLGMLQQLGVAPEMMAQR